MLLAGRRLDGGNNLSGHADFGKGMEGSELVRAKIAKRLKQPNHALLHNVLMVCADKKIRTRLGAHEILVFVEQIFRCVGIPLLGKQGDFFIGHVVKILMHGNLPAHSLPLRMRSKTSR